MWQYVVGGVAMIVIIIIWELSKEGIARIHAKTEALRRQNAPEVNQIGQINNMLDVIDRIRKEEA